jgi:hypothetical protein
VQAFLGVDRGPLRTWRYATGGVAEIVTAGGRTRREFTFASNGGEAAVGYASTVDAMVFAVAMPDSLDDFKLQHDLDRLRQLRTDRFRFLANKGLESSGLGPFAAEWVVDVVLSVAADAALRGEGIGALKGLDSDDWQSRAEAVVDGVLLAGSYADTEELPLRDTVLEALRDRGVLGVLAETLPVLNQDSNAAWLPWIRSRFLQTLAASLQAAAQQLCLDFNVDTDAVVDVLDDGHGVARIVVSDAVPGGGGLIETLTRRLADDPRRFEALVMAAVEPSDTEEVDPTLRQVLQLMSTSKEVAEAAHLFRTATAERLDAWRTVVACLNEQGVGLTHASTSALATRLFRPGSSADSDALLRLLLERWDAIDTAAGFAIDHRAVCAFLAQDPDVLAGLRRIAAPRGESSPRSQSVLLSLLWTRACARRPVSLRATNRFVSDPPPTERTLLKGVLPSPPEALDIDAADWRANLAIALRGWATARLHSTSNDVSALSGAVRELTVVPLEVDWLQAYAQVQGVARDGVGYSVLVALREAPQ